MDHLHRLRLQPVLRLLLQQPAEAAPVLEGVSAMCNHRREQAVLLVVDLLLAGVDSPIGNPSVEELCLGPVAEVLLRMVVVVAMASKIGSLHRDVQMTRDHGGGD
jgi:hypothetical protein